VGGCEWLRVKGQKGWRFPLPPPPLPPDGCGTRLGPSTCLYRLDEWGDVSWLRVKSLTGWRYTLPPPPLSRCDAQPDKVQVRVVPVAPSRASWRALLNSSAVESACISALLPTRAEASCSTLEEAKLHRKAVLRRGGWVWFGSELPDVGPSTRAPL
jgi:hypothetical protein